MTVRFRMLVAATISYNVIEAITAGVDQPQLGTTVLPINPKTGMPAVSVLDEDDTESSRRAGRRDSA